MVNEFETTINIPIEVHSNFLYLTSGSTLTYEVSYESYNIETVEEESLEQFSISLEANANAMGNYNGISLTMSVTPEVNYFVENIKTYSYMASLREAVSYSINYPIQDTALYRVETRGNFYISVIQVLEPTFVPENIVNVKFLGIKIGTEWDNFIDYFTLIEQYVVLEYIQNTATTGLYKYQGTAENYVYDDYIVSGSVFY